MAYFVLLRIADQSIASSVLIGTLDSEIEQSADQLVLLNVFLGKTLYAHMHCLSSLSTQMGTGKSYARGIMLHWTSIHPWRVEHTPEISCGCMGHSHVTLPVLEN